MNNTANFVRLYQRSLGKFGCNSKLSVKGLITPLIEIEPRHYFNQQQLPTYIIRGVNTIIITVVG